MSATPRAAHRMRSICLPNLDFRPSTIAFTVQPKADSIYKIVGAASIAAKVCDRTALCSQPACS